LLGSTKVNIYDMTDLNSFEEDTIQNFP